MELISLLHTGLHLHATLLSFLLGSAKKIAQKRRLESSCDSIVFTFEWTWMIACQSPFCCWHITLCCLVAARALYVPFLSASAPQELYSTFWYFLGTFSLDLFALAARPLVFIAFRPQGTLPCMMSAFEEWKWAYSKDEKGRMKDLSEKSR